MKEIASVSLFAKKVEKVSTKQSAGAVSEKGFLGEIGGLFAEEGQLSVDPKSVISSFLGKSVGPEVKPAIEEALGEIKQTIKSMGLFPENDIDVLFDSLLNVDEDKSGVDDVFSTILMLIILTLLMKLFDLRQQMNESLRKASES